MRVKGIFAGGNGGAEWGDFGRGVAPRWLLGQLGDAWA